jgi:CRISPR-associated protein Cmr4
MYKIARPFFMVVETPLHAGSGTELGVVDMPIQRERHTRFPKIEASGLKGCIREAFEELKAGDSKVKSDKLKEEFPDLEDKWEIERDGKKEIKKKDGKELIKFDEAISLAFGPEEGDAHAGALGFTDARVLLFPVKSMKGVFAWITCPKVLDLFKRDLELAGIKDIPDMPKEKTAPKDCLLFIKGDKIVLEEYTFEINKDNNGEGTCSKFAEWLSKKVIPSGNEYNYWQEKIKNDVVVLQDDDFRDFVNLSTEVITRTKIDNETGTVQSGALFTEEYLPSETILYSLALATPIFNNKKGVFQKTNDKNEEYLVMEYFTKGLPEVIQIGGNATIGKGIVRTSGWRDEDG